MTITRRSSTAAASALLTVLLLTSCTTEPDATPSSPSSTPVPAPPSSTPGVSPSPSRAPGAPVTAPSPASDEDATTGAAEAVEQFLIVRAQVNAAGGTDTTPLEAVSTGRALALAQQDAAFIAEGMYRVEGRLKFDTTTAYAGTLTTADGATSYPFASVTVTGCQDGSEYRIFNPDGTPAPQPPDPRSVIELTAIWEPNLGTWMVENGFAKDESC
jgi:hypothetical protein